MNEFLIRARTRIETMTDDDLVEIIHTLSDISVLIQREQQARWMARKRAA